MTKSNAQSKIYQDLSDRLIADHADKADVVKSAPVLIAHFNDLSGLTPTEKAQYSYACLVMMIEESLDESVYHVSRTGGLKGYQTARLMILSALNNAPHSWQEAQEDLFYQKGLIRGLDKFYEAQGQNLRGGAFDQLRRTVPDHLQPIISAAIDCAHTRKNRFGWSTLERGLYFVAAQLQPEGPEKTALLEDLRYKGGTKPYRDSMKASAQGIRIIAEQLGIEPESLPTLDKAEDTARQKVVYLSESMAKAASHKPLETGDEKAAKILNAQLGYLVSRGRLSDREKEIYSYMVTDRGNNRGLPNDVEVVSKFTRSGTQSTAGEILRLDDVRNLRVRVPQLMTSLAAEIAQNEMILSR